MLIGRGEGWIPVSETWVNPLRSYLLLYWNYVVDPMPQTYHSWMIYTVYTVHTTSWWSYWGFWLGYTPSFGSTPVGEWDGLWHKLSISGTEKMGFHMAFLFLFLYGIGRHWVYFYLFVGVVTEWCAITWGPMLEAKVHPRHDSFQNPWSTNHCYGFWFTTSWNKTLGSSRSYR